MRKKGTIFQQVFPFYYRFNEQSIWYKNYWPGAVPFSTILYFANKSSVQSVNKRLLSILSNSPTTLRMFIYQHAKSFSYGRNECDLRKELLCARQCLFMASKPTSIYEILFILFRFCHKFFYSLFFHPLNLWILVGRCRWYKRRWCEIYRLELLIW